MIKKIIKKLIPKRYHDFIKQYLLYRPIGKKRTNAVSCDKSLPQGINIIGIVRSGTSIGLQCRLIAKALDAVNIPYCMIDLCDYLNIEKQNFDYNYKITNELVYNVNLIVLNADVINQALRAINYKEMNKRYNAGYWAWELSEFPDVRCRGFHSLNEVWANSHFSAEAIAKKTDVHVMPLPLYSENISFDIKYNRDYFNLKKDIFLFMAAYDCDSHIGRKNPQAAIKAFIRAFSPQDKHVGLILKINKAKENKKHVDELSNMLSGYQNIYYIDNFLKDEEMSALTAASDAFVSLHRAEGLGLIPMEAMLLGTPVISTGYSGNMEYMTKENTALVGYNLVPVKDKFIGAYLGKEYVWAEPNIEEAAENMKRLVSDSKWREGLIQNGKNVKVKLNANVMGNTMRKRLEDIGLINKETA